MRRTVPTVGIQERPRTTITAKQSVVQNETNKIFRELLKMIGIKRLLLVQ